MDRQHFLEYMNAATLCDCANCGGNGSASHASIDLFNLLDLVDHSGQFIQVCHPEDYTMVFANQQTRTISGHPDEPYEGKLCFEYLLGTDAPCGHCPMKQMGDEAEKTIEVDDGDHVFQLKARYATWNGKKVFIEYGRDVTDAKAAQLRYAHRMRSIIENIPEGQGVFHVDLTADEWLSSSGIAENAQRMQNVEDVDTLIRMIAAFVPDEAGQERFFETFCRERELESFARGKHQIVLETESYYDDRSIRWSRITAHLLENPGNGHVESIIYGVDISSERARVSSLERDKERRKAEGRAGSEMREAGGTADDTQGARAQVDHGHRRDLLTGLNSRLALYDVLCHVGKDQAPSAAGVLMVDLDDFKRVNAAFGHSVGDACLASLGDAFDRFGAEHGVTFYRFGGDEVVGLAQDKAGDVSRLANALLETVRSLSVLLESGDEIHLTASIGYTTDASECQKAIDRAGKAMRAAKQRGKNQVACLD